MGRSYFKGYLLFSQMLHKFKFYFVAVIVERWYCVFTNRLKIFHMLFSSDNVTTTFDI